MTRNLQEAGCTLIRKEQDDSEKPENYGSCYKLGENVDGKGNDKEVTRAPWSHEVGMKGKKKKAQIKKRGTDEIRYNTLKNSNNESRKEQASECRDNFSVLKTIQFSYLC